MNAPAPDSEPLILIQQRGDSFTSLWEELAAELRARLLVGSDVAASGSLRSAAAVLLALPGEEERAAEACTALGAAGAGDFAVVGAAAEHRLAVAALRAGAGEYFALPVDLAVMRSWIAERVAVARARVGAAAHAARERERLDFSQIVGESDGIRAALGLAARIIPRGSATVLITGETGTGKEVLARAIHHNGPRSAAPFVEVNCTALPATLLEAELFGYEKGAFTDARTAKPGLFEAAQGGTLFLDEIGDLPLELQAKLLRALEEKRVRRLGSMHSVQLDVRILAATHVDLEAAVRAGRFREDLYFRLNVLTIELPPLRARGSDVLLLADRFLAAFAEEYDVPGISLSEDVRRALLTYPWPGNVRELRNAIERAVLLGDGALRVDDLFQRRSAGALRRGDGELPFPATLAEIEHAAAQRMVARLGGNKSAAADVLGISRTRLYRLLEGDVA